MINTQYQFNEMVDTTGSSPFIINPIDSIITIIFQDTLLKESDEIGVSDDYFLTPALNLTDLDISETIDIPEIPDISETVPINLSDYVSGLPANTLLCLPEDTINSIFDNIAISPDTINLDIKNLIEGIIFQEYDYLTINKAISNIAIIDDNLPFDIILEYEIIGYLNDTLFSDINPNISLNDIPKRIKNNLIFNYSFSPDLNVSNCLIPFLNIPGWEYDTSVDYTFNLDINIDIENIESVTGTTQDISKPDTLISIPLILNNLPIDILSGRISESTAADTNRFNFNIINNYLLPLKISMEMKNFISNETDLQISINDTINQNQTLNKVINLNNSLFQHYPELNDTVIVPIDSIFMNIGFTLLSSNDTFDYDSLANIQFSISDIVIEPLVFDTLKAVVDSITMETPSLAIDNIPSGFQGIVFSDPSLLINIYNQISIDNIINLNIEAISNQLGESETLIINTPIYDPNISEGDLLAHTCIKLSDETTYVFNGECSLECNLPECTETPNIGISLVDLLSISPDTLKVTGQAIINGTGILTPNKYVWGDFILEAPFSIELGSIEINGEDTLFQNLNVIPAQSSLLEGINQDTKETIDSSLISASIISDIENHTPLAGNMSLLVSSHSNFFPLFIDEIISEACMIDSCVYDSGDVFSLAVDTLSIKYPEGIGENNINNINKIVYRPMSETDNRVKQLLFYKNNDEILFWIGRIMDFVLPFSEINNDGNIEQPGNAVIETSIDPTQISMINKSEERYLNSFISLTNSYDMNSDNSTDTTNSDGIVNIHSTDYIKIQSYVSFIISSAGF